VSDVAHGTLVRYVYMGKYFKNLFLKNYWDKKAEIYMQVV
jgi:hypothetical protein